MNRRREDTSGANTFNQVQTRICISKPFYAVTERALRCTFDNSVSRKCSEIPSGRGGPSNRVTVERCVFFHSLIFSEKKENLLPTYHCQTEQFTEKRSEQETIRKFERGLPVGILFLYFVFFWLASSMFRCFMRKRSKTRLLVPGIHREVSARRQIVLTKIQLEDNRNGKLSERRQ